MSRPQLRSLTKQRGGALSRDTSTLTIAITTSTYYTIPACPSRIMTMFEPRSRGCAGASTPRPMPETMYKEKPRLYNKDATPHSATHLKLIQRTWRLTRKQISASWRGNAALADIMKNGTETTLSLLSPSGPGKTAHRDNGAGGGVRTRMGYRPEGF